MPESTDTRIECFVVDPKVYCLNAVKKAAYKFADKYFVEVSAPDPQHIQISARHKSGSKLSKDEQQEFVNEILDQELREVVAKETEGVRNLLLAQAFSKVSLITPELE